MSSIVDSCSRRRSSIRSIDYMSSYVGVLPGGGLNRLLDSLSDESPLLRIVLRVTRIITRSHITLYTVYTR